MTSQAIKHRKFFTMLLAEDDDDDFYFIRKACEEVNETAVLKRVTDGRLLMDELKRHGLRLPAIVILDLNMPIVNGRETLQRLGENFGSGLPVVVLTASNHPHEKQYCLDNGALAFFTKPCHYNGYVEIIQSISELLRPVQTAKRN